jgi:hypothetical protein
VDECKPLALGVLRRGHLVEADRASLVAGYSGQTALKTKAVVAEALGRAVQVDRIRSTLKAPGAGSLNLNDDELL